MLTPFSVTLTVAAIRKPLEDLYSSAKGAVKTKIKTIGTDAKLKLIYKNITSVQKVKTMWQIDKEVKLQSFYYPSQITISDKPKAIGSIADIETDRNFVVLGTVGQGKSIFLRFLCIKELAASKRLPIFIELRRYESKESLLDFIIKAIQAYGFPCDAEIFEYLAQSGKLVLLLDAFDEIDPESVTAVLHEIEVLAQRYAALQIVITSRNDSGIERSPHFRVYRLTPLRPADHKPFLEKIIDDKTRVTQLLSAISASSVEIKSLLQTPLLLTLLVIVYNSTQGIPSTLSEFYDELFHTLITRHDNTKPGFRRRRATRLNDSDLKKLFEAFCYYARQQDLLVLTSSKMTASVEKASDVTGILCNPDEFAKDITKVACLMQQEGFQYHFIHKSVAEFHAASFICHTSEENAVKFYSAVLNTKWQKWRQELVFLSQIDRYRYLRYFYVPSSLEALTPYGISANSLDTPCALDEAAARDLLNNYTITVDMDSTSKATSSVTLNAMNNCIAHELELSIINKLFVLWAPSDSSPRTFKLGDYLHSKGSMSKGHAILIELLEKQRLALRSAIDELDREVRMGDFVNP